MTKDIDALGTFLYTYVGATPRLSTISFPNGESTGLDYFSNSGDRRLKEIWNKLSSGGTISKFDYTYDPAGIITQWTQQRGTSPARVLSPAYDLADRLSGATNSNPSRIYAYGYDAANNRLSELIDSSMTTASYNALNELVSLSTNAYPNQNYEWDAENRLAAINYPDRGQRTEFTYDGLNHWVRIVEKTGGTVASDKWFVWCDQKVCEERNSAGTVTKRFFSHGVSLTTGPSAGNYYYATDHLGSLVALRMSSGNLRAEYEYDPWGRRTKSSGDSEADFGFAGYYNHVPSSLQFATFRAYDAGQGRWISRDPHPEAELLRKAPTSTLMSATVPLL